MYVSYSCIENGIYYLFGMKKNSSKTRKEEEKAKKSGRMTCSVEYDETYVSKWYRSVSILYLYLSLAFIKIYIWNVVYQCGMPSCRELPTAVTAKYKIQLYSERANERAWLCWYILVAMRRGLAAMRRETLHIPVFFFFFFFFHFHFSSSFKTSTFNFICSAFFHSIFSAIFFE